MPFSVALDEVNGVVLARFFGPSDNYEAWRGIGEIRSLVDDRPVDGVLIDLRDLDYMPGADEIRNFAIEFVSFLGRRRLAFVTRLQVHTDLARVIARQAASRGLDVEVFSNQHEASEWLDASS